MSNISMRRFLARFRVAWISTPLLQGPGEAFRSAIKHRAPAAHPSAVDVVGAIVDEQDRLGHGHAHPLLSAGEEHAVRLAHAELSGINDLIEMGPEARLVSQVGDAMVLLV